MSTAFPLALAMLLDALLGEPRWLWTRLPHPAVLMGRAITILDRALNNAPGQRLKGLFVLGLLGAGAWGIGHLLALAGPVVELLCAAILLAQKSLALHVRAVADALRLSVADGRSAVAMIVSRDCRAMTGPEVARAAIESAAENLSDGVIAPAFWFLIAGLPGLCLYKAVNTADSMIGYRTERYRAFGWAAARTDDLLNLLPARLTGLLIALTTGQLRTWARIAQDARRHKSPNAGWPEAAMARVLGVALAGPRSYDGRMQPLDWVHETGRHDIGADEVDAAIRVLWKVWTTALLLVLCLGLL